MTLGILAITGSLRARSSNTAVLRAAQRLAPEGIRITLSSALDTLPHFNPDLDAEGLTPPPAVSDFRRAVNDADALLICSPEYAHGVPGTLKNALDWLVSVPGLPGKPVGLLNASPRSLHAQTSLAETLWTMSLSVTPPEPIIVPLANRSLDPEAIARDEVLAGPIRGVIDALAAAVAVEND